MCRYFAGPFRCAPAFPDSSAKRCCFKAMVTLIHGAPGGWGDSSRSEEVQVEEVTGNFARYCNSTNVRGPVNIFF